MSGLPILRYFNLRSRGELIRLVYAYGNLPLYERTVPFGHEFMTIKPSLPFGSVPVLTLEDKDYAQSIAIARYGAKQCGLYPLQDHVAALEVDMIVDSVVDMMNPIINGTFLEKDVERREKTIHRLNKYTLPAILNGIQERIPDQTSPYILSEISLADLAVFDVITNILLPEKNKFPIDFETKYPKLMEIVHSVEQEKPIAAYLSRNENQRPYKPSWAT